MLVTQEMKNPLNPSLKFRRITRTAAILAGSFAASSLLHAEPAAARKISPVGKSLQVLQAELESSRVVLERRLNPAAITPEQRSILIENWLKETAPLQKNIAETQQKELGIQNRQSLRETKSLPISIPADASPLQRDILEMENEILEATNTLNNQNHTPEERAIQVEAFLTQNRSAFAQLEKYRAQLANERLGRKTPSDRSSASTEKAIHAEFARSREADLAAARRDNPALARILESENQVASFVESLRSSGLPVEQQSIAMEKFLLTNRESIRATERARQALASKSR